MLIALVFTGVLLALGSQTSLAGPGASEPEEVDTDKSARRETAEQMLGSMKGQARVAYAKMGTAPKTLKGDIDGGGAGVAEEEMTANSISIHDKVYILENEKMDAALVAEDSADGSAVIMRFNWAGGDSDFEWYDSLDALDEAHEEIEFDDKSTSSTPGEKEPGAAEVKDPWALYRKQGRKWKHKNVTMIEGMDPMISYIEYEIIEVGDDYCVQTMLMLDGEGDPYPGMDAQEIRIDFGDRSDMEGTDGEDYEIETIKVEAGEFECYLLDFGDTEAWTSVQYPGLLVKSKDSASTVELVEFSDGDDDEKDTSSEPAPEEGEGKKADMGDYWERYVSTFKKGRNWTLKMAAGINLKTEVISVDEEKAVVKSTSYMNGNVIGEPTETDYSLVEPKEDPEDAEQLEWTEKEITVEAGTFECVSPDGKTWLMKKHPLIIVKTPAMELIEFNE